MALIFLVSSRRSYLLRVRLVGLGFEQIEMIKIIAVSSPLQQQLSEWWKMFLTFF